VSEHPPRSSGFALLAAIGATICLFACFGFAQTEFVNWQFPRLIHVTDPRWLHLAVVCFRTCLFVDAILLLYLTCRLWFGNRLKVPDQCQVAGRRAGETASKPTVLGTSVRSWILPVTCLMVTGGMFRLMRVDTDLWLDELATVLNFADASFVTILATFPSANHHPLNSLLMRASVWLMGETAFSIRLPAVLFGIAGIGAIVYLAKTVTSRSEAIATGLLLALSYHHIWFSQSARGYTGYLFGSLLGTAFFLRLLKRDETGARIGYVAAMFVAFCSHLNTSFVFAAQIMAFALCSVCPNWFRCERPVAGRSVLKVMLLTAFLTFHFYALMLPEIVAFVVKSDRTGVGFHFLSTLFWNVVSRGMNMGDIGLPALLAAGGVVGIGVCSYARQSRLLVLVLTMPLLIGLAVAVALAVGVYPRFFLLALPVGLLFAVRGFHLIAWVASRLLARNHQNRRHLSLGFEATLVVAALCVIAAPLPRYYRLPKQAYRRALHFVRENRRADAKIVAGPLAIHGCRYYDASVFRLDSAKQLRELQSDNQDLWLMYTFPDTLRAGHPELWDCITENFRIAARFDGTVVNGTIIVCRFVGPPESKDKSDWPSNEPVITRRHFSDNRLQR
jgi:hypothetical protein